MSLLDVPLNIARLFGRVRFLSRTEDILLDAESGERVFDSWARRRFRSSFAGNSILFRAVIDGREVEWETISSTSRCSLFSEIWSLFHF